MKITRIDAHAVDVDGRSSWVFVQVQTDAGMHGLGEMNPSAPREKCLAALQRLGAALQGRDPRCIEALSALFEPAKLDRFEVHALSAIEQALWDILGKWLEAPVHALMGGPCRDQIRLYANITRATRRCVPEVFAANAAAAVAEGFDAVKLAPFGSVRTPLGRQQDIENGIRCVRAVREAIGAGVDLLVDCYSLYTSAEALAIADALRELDLFWFEEPVADEDVEAYLEVKGRCGMRVAGGERRMLRQGFWEAIEHRMMDVIMPDITIVGGLGELKKVAAMAAARQLLTAPHGPFGPVIVAAQAQAMAAHPEFLILEYAWGQVPWREELIIPAERVENGRLAVARRPGLGVELNMAVVEKQRLKGSEWAGVP